MIDNDSNWLDIENEKLFYTHHLPKNKSIKSAVIIISPVGPEYMHCYRSVKMLARELAEKGFHSIRYDPIGIGNSTGDLEDPDIWGKWINCVNHITTYLKNGYEIEDIVLVGLRSGCLVLSDALMVLPKVNAVFWYPYTMGAKYVRDIELLDSMLYRNKDLSTEDDTLDGGGYPVTADLKSKIKNINLKSIESSKLSNILIINSKETNVSQNFHNRMLEMGVNSEQLDLDGLDAMTKQAAISKIPISNIGEIVNWVAKTNVEESTNSDQVTITRKFISHHNYSEEICYISDKRKIFGILTKPLNECSGSIVILPNTGAAHNVGPNRFHVDVARKYTTQGISTLRIDLSNLGESCDTYGNESQHPYPSTAADDINGAINYVSNEHHYDDVILCGLCSGAHNIFHAALEAKSNIISKIIFINPLTFYWKPGQSIFAPEESQAVMEEIYYKKQLLNYKKWLNLITNPKKSVNIIAFLFQLVGKLFRTLQRKIIGFFTDNESLLSRDIRRLVSKGIAISLINSMGDPGKKILTSKASKLIEELKARGLYTNIEISDADHTFSSRESRAELIKALLHTTTP